MIHYLYTKNLLNEIPYDPSKSEILAKNQELQNNVDQFWNCFDTSIKINKRGLDGKQRILSVITNDFGRQEINENLKVGFKKIIFCSALLYIIIFLKLLFHFKGNNLTEKYIE